MFKRLLASASLGLMLFAGSATFAQAPQAQACGPNDTFLGIRAWHYYLPCDGDSVSQDISLDQVWLIALAVFESMLFIAGIVAVIFVIWGGVKYVTSQGRPEATSSALKTIINAIAGTVIAVSSTVLVRFLINLLAPGGLNRGALNLPNAAQDDVISRVFSFAYAVIGVITVMYIVIGSIKFATSTGDPGKAASARNTIIYAVVGLVVVIAASTITDFVLTRLGES